MDKIELSYDNTPDENEEWIEKMYGVIHDDGFTKRNDSHYCSCGRSMTLQQYDDLPEELAEHLRENLIEDFEVYKCSCGQYKTVIFEEWEYE